MIYASYLRADIQEASGNRFCYMRSFVIAVEMRGFTRYLRYSQEFMLVHLLHLATCCTGDGWRCKHCIGWDLIGVI